MFRRTRNSQADLFTNIGNQLSERKQRMLDDPAGWHNTFHRDIVSRIDEGIFAVLFDEKMGRPNASIRELIGMIILKEGNGWSDEQLFEECRFNLKVMRALGKANIDEDVPVEATYYDFRRLLHEYNETHEEDLFKKAFQDVTIKQMKAYGIQGKKIRMDSKLINSNIARSSRLHLILEAVRKYISKMDIKTLQSVVGPEIYKVLEVLREKSTSNVLYPMTNAEKKKLLHLLGPGIKAILDHYEDLNEEGEYHTLLRQIFDDQYIEKDQPEQPVVDQVKSAPDQKSEEPEDKRTVQVQQEPPTKDDQTKTPDDQSHQTKPESDDNKAENSSEIEPKDKKQIDSSSVQSVHDPDATFRTKGSGQNKQQVRGYHGNITEVCDEENGLNLIVDGELVTANESEDSFLLSSVSECENMMGEIHDLPQGEKSHIEEVITDGGYDSIENRKEMVKPEKPIWRLAKMKGKALSFHMECDDEGNFNVWERCSGKRCQVTKSRNGKKIVIITPAGNRRYFTKEQMKNYLIKLEVQSNQDQESYNLRANVESTINQVFHRLGQNKKVKYRGYQSCNTYMFSRIFWANHRRIVSKLAEDLHKSHQNVQNGLESVQNGLRNLGILIWCFLMDMTKIQKFIWALRSKYRSLLFSS